MVGIAYLVWKFKTEPQLCSRAAYSLPAEILSRVKPDAEYELGDISEAVRWSHSSLYGFLTSLQVQLSSDGTSGSEGRALNENGGKRSMWDGIEEAFAGSAEDSEASQSEESDTVVEESRSPVSGLKAALAESSDSLPDSKVDLT